uniref:Uncharacterized protein n=2 Tax=Oryza rufipogon TaxID=4529 RepID=A0A0E0R7U7_ORYRU
MDGVPKLTVKELKKRYTALSVEEKAALVQRNRENRERKNSASISGTGSQTVNCQPSFQPVPSSTPMSSSTPGKHRFWPTDHWSAADTRHCLLPIRPPYKASLNPTTSVQCCPVDHYANFPNSVRKVTLMDSKNQELLQPAEQNNAPRKSEVVIVEDNEVCERNMASSGAGRDERWILAGATALVTGRSKGIGRAIVEELVGFGSTVHTCARSEAELSRCQEELTAKGLAVSFSVCDVSVRTDREELVSRVRELFGGKLNILVNNAGLTLSKLTLETTTSDYTQQIVANFESCFHLSQLLHPLLKAFERGSIINISSISSYLAYPYLAVYSAAKGAMNQFSKALASDWAGDNIRINCVAPGLTRTPLLEEHPTPSVKET